MTRPDFLIILPVRNGGHHLVQAIDGVLAQTYPHWRMVVLENASTDDTAATLARVNDQRITVRSADRPLSIHENWHRGYDLLGEGVNGDTLVTFLGHDDVFEPHFLADIADLAERHPDATLYQTLFDLIDENDGRMRPCRPVPDTESWTALLAFLLWNLRDSFGTGYVFRAADYRRVGGIPDLPMLLFSDFLVFVRLTRLGYKACNFRSGFAYRRHTGSTSGTPSKEKHAAALRSMHAFVQFVRTEFKEFVDTDLGRAGVAALLARELSLMTVPIIRRSFSAEDRRLLGELQAIYDESAGGVLASTLVGQPYRPSRLFIGIRRFNAAQAYLRYQWFGRHRRK